MRPPRRANLLAGLLPLALVLTGPEVAGAELSTAPSGRTDVDRVITLAPLVPVRLAPGGPAPRGAAGLRSEPVPRSMTASSGRSSVRLSGTQSTWDVTFLTERTANHPGAVPFPEQAKDAYLRAVARWASILPSDQEIDVTAAWEQLPAGAAPDPGLLGFAGPGGLVTEDTAPGYVSPIVLVEARERRDINQGAADIDSGFNRAQRAWWFDAEPPPPDQIDFETIVLHELGHGLGFLGSAGQDRPSAPLTLGFPAADGGRLLTHWDANVVRRSGQGTDLLTSYANPSPPLTNALESDELFWDGPLGVRGNAGVRPKLFAPASYGFEAGESFSHLDEQAYPVGTPNALMTPFLAAGERITSPGTIAIGILADLGWFPAKDARYVDAAYRAVLGRPADPEGSAFWRDLIRDRTVTRRGFALALALSPEHRVQVVRQLYADLLSRPGTGGPAPTPEELAGWAEQLARDGNPNEVAVAFLSGPQHYAQAGGSDVTWVDALYRDVLGRAPDPTGRATSLAAARARPALARSLYGSPEALRRRVDEAYRASVGRPADPSGLASWPASVQQDGDTLLAASLASTAEFWERAQKRTP